METMTQDDKELLLKDLCARLPYGVKVESIFINSDTKEHKPCGIEVFDATSILMIRDGLGEFKPYLFPMSSMTEEQKNDCPISETNLNIINSNIGYGIIEMPWRLSYLFVEWCNKNHFDYRGLIPKGLALDATGKSIY